MKLAENPTLDPSPVTFPVDPRLPHELEASIEISNATSVGEQPAILANLALGNEIFNGNLQQQALVAQQQALNQILLVATAKFSELILKLDATKPEAGETLRQLVAQAKETLQQLATGLAVAKTPADPEVNHG